MKPSIISRTIAALALGLLMGITLYHGETKSTALGRDEFLKREADSYDRQHANPLPPATAIARGVAGAGLSIGVYELMAFGIFKLLNKNDRRSRRR